MNVPRGWSWLGMLTLVLLTVGLAAGQAVTPGGWLAKTVGGVVGMAIGYALSRAALRSYAQRSEVEDDVVYRVRTERERLAILVGIAAALDRWDEVSRVVAGAADDEESRAAVSALLGVDDMVATAVLDMQLRRITAEAQARLRTEIEELQGRQSASQ